MNDRPLISVITGTRNRPVELQQAIQCVREQTYAPLEHVIVSDGPDPYLRKWLTSEGEQNAAWRARVGLIFQETGRVWSDEWTASPGAAAFQVAQLLAHGELQMWLSDDETMTPDHIESLYNLLEEQNADFAYSKARWYTAPGVTPRVARIIGTDPPQPEELTNCLYRTVLLEYGKFETHRGRKTDWAQVDCWLAAGARYAFLDRVTFEHRADQFGGTYPEVFSPRLRGHDQRAFA